jgi:cytochrome c-type biogenesis protein CcsB
MIPLKIGFLSNFSFFSLFFSMFLYWIYAFFFFKAPTQVALQQTNNSLKGSDLSFRSTDTVYKSDTRSFKAKNVCLQLGNLGMFFSNITLFLLLVLRWKESGHFPLSNLYESLLFLSWSCTFLHVGLNLKNLWSNNQMIQFSNDQLIFELTGCVTSPCALFTNAFASFSLPDEMQKITPLVPALQSNWLMMHVTVMIFSYSALIIGSLLSIAFIIVTKGQEIKIGNRNNFSEKPLYQRNLDPIQDQAFEAEFKSPKIANNVAIRSMEISEQPFRLKIAEILDNLSYRIIGLGFPFLTVGILSGAVWANEAWGSYWSWDPKETWAFLTWLVFAIYLHTRLSKGWEGKKPAVIASLGFLIIWICYLGVNLLGEGLHSYGWLR